MYRVETTAGFALSAVNVESAISALSRQLDDRRSVAGLGWSVTTPHGTVLTDRVDVDQNRTDGPTPAAAALERAYALLVRDHLTHSTPTTGTSQFLTM